MLDGGGTLLIIPEQPLSPQSRHILTLAHGGRSGKERTLFRGDGNESVRSRQERVSRFGTPFALFHFCDAATTFVGHVDSDLPRACSLRAAARTTIATTTAAAAPGGDASSAQPDAGSAATADAPVNRRTAPPSFIAKNNVNLDGDLISSREGEPTAEELANENVIKIVAQMGTDDEVNWLVWKCFGEPREGAEGRG